MSRTLRYQTIRADRRRFLLIRITIAAALSLFVTITTFVLNVNQQILAETKPLVGADIVFDASQPISGDTIAVLEKIGQTYPLQYSRKVQFYTNITLTGQESKLVQVMWADSNYPLYGSLDIVYLTWNEWSPVSGTVFTDQQTYDQFTKDNTITIWTQQFRVAGILNGVQTTSLSVFDDGRKILLPYDDVALTQLTEFGSRVSYQLLVKVLDERDYEPLLRTLRSNTSLTSVYQIEGYQRRIEQITNLTSEFDRFITIILIVTFLLVSTSIFIAVRTYFLKHQRTIGILKILWQWNTKTLLTYSSIFWVLFVTARIVACGVGRWSVLALREFPLTADFVHMPQAWREGAAVWAILAFLSLSVPLWHITSTPALRLLAPSSALQSNTFLSLQIVLSIAGIFILYLITLHAVRDAAVFTALLAWGIALLSFGIRKLLQAAVRISAQRRKDSFLSFDGIRSTTAPWNQSILMTIWLIVCVTSLVVITGISRSFLNQLTLSTTDQPTTYVLNILPSDVSQIKTAYPDAVLYDVILARIQSVNDIPLQTYLRQNRTEQNTQEHDQQDWTSQWWSWQSAGGDPEWWGWEWGWEWGFNREYNVTTQPLETSPVIQWTAVQSGGVSLDQDFAQRLDVTLWDYITFFIQGRTFKLEVTGIRASWQRTTVSPFFFIQFDDEQFADAPKTYFRAANIPADQKPQFKSDLLQELWPHLSFIDIDQIVETVRDIASRLISVIQTLVWCLMIFVVITIIICLDAMKTIKREKIILYHLLGATPKMLSKILSAEYIFLFGIVLSLAVVLGYCIIGVVLNGTALLQRSRWVLLMPLGGVAAICLLITGVTRITYRTLVRIPWHRL